MKTKLSEGNPFGLDAKGYLWEMFAERGASECHLDYGSHDGDMLVKLATGGLVKNAVGLDLNSAVVARSVGRMPSNVSLLAIKKNAPLPFPDGWFTSVSMIGVLEHIHDQGRIIRELRRVTRSGGDILFAVPGRHFFSFLDMGNWKFVFPKLHRWFYLLTHSESEYTSRFSANIDGLIGDVEVEKGWHEHFSRDQLKDLLESHGLEVVDVDGAGFFYRIFANIKYFLPSKAGFIINPLLQLDARLFSSGEIWILARKP